MLIADVSRPVNSGVRLLPNLRIRELKRRVKSTSSPKQQSFIISEDTLWKIKIKIHAFYIVGILMGVITLLASFRLGDIPNLGERLSFALTLASLLLAILAIGYNVVSNTSFSQTITKLNDASKDIAITATSISAAANDLSQKIEGIPSKLESVEGKIEITNALLQKYSDKKDEPALSEKERQAANEIVDSFVGQISASGLVFLYAFSIAYEKKRQINIKDLCSAMNYPFPEKSPSSTYPYGFYVATSSAGLIGYNNENVIFTPTMINKKLSQNIPSELDGRLKSDDITENIKSYLQKQFPIVEKFFN